MNTCPACDGELPAKRYQGNPRKWCSEACRVWALRHPGEKKKRERTCEVCSSTIEHLQYKAVVCSESCRNIRDGRRQSARLLAQERACAFCGSGFRSRSSATKCCSMSCAQRLRRSRPKTPAALAASRERLRQAWQRKNRRRRALKRGAVSEYYTLSEIANRDRGVCQLCKKRVAMTKRAPHPKSPVIDHVLPLARGGDDTRANVQLAHFLCNSIKSAGGSQQLALIG